MSALVICGYLWAAWWVTWLVWALQSKKTIERESVASAISYRLVGVAGAYLLASGRGLAPLVFNAIIPDHRWLGVLGIIVTAGGLALTYWARYALGGNWSGEVTVKAEHELIRTGPYRVVRHPIYTGIITAAAGTAIAEDQWRSIIAVVLLWLSFTMKRLKEEQYMRQTFGDQYADYARTTGAIFPTVRRHG